MEQKYEKAFVSVIKNYMYLEFKKQFQIVAKCLW